MTTTRKPTGYVIYSGPSLLDGKPIVAIALTGSTNRKTGNMVQTYILADNRERPTVNLKNGADASICGDCKHRPANGGSCYVVVAQGPTAVWKTLEAGKYPIAQDISALGAGRMVRLGTYGDPAAVPASVWQALVSKATGRTGYTHQWATGKGSAPELRSLVMASADTEAEAIDAQSQGWRTFRVRVASDAMLPRESVCPASEEAGKLTTCDHCGLCNGAAGRRGSVAIIVHGSTASRYIAIRSLSAA